MPTLSTQTKNFGKLEIPDQKLGNTRLNVMPFEQTKEWIDLPEEYEKWEGTLNEILKKVPLQEGATQHYITICSDFFTEDGFQREEGPHMDGNFCVDPTFVNSENQPIKGWGGTSPAPCPSPSPGWGNLLPSPTVLTEQPDNSHVIMNWKLPYDIVIPISKYVSGSKGGLFIVSSNVGTKVWDGKFKGRVGPLGSFESMKNQLTDDRKQLVPKNELVFMTSNTPHESLLVKAGERRTFMRLTLNHNYNNKAILAA